MFIFIEKEDNQYTAPLSNLIWAKIGTTNCRAKSREWSGAGGGESYKSKIRRKYKSRNWKRSRRASIGVSTLLSRITEKWVKNQKSADEVEFAEFRRADSGISKSENN